MYSPRAITVSSPRPKPNPIYDDENGRRASLRDAEISKILESEGELVILANLYQGRRCP